MIRLILAALLLASCAAGQTINSVSGDFGEDQTITITGTNFGTKVSGPTMLHEKWESGVAGDPVTNHAIGWVESGVKDDPWKYTSVARSGLAVSLILPDPISGGELNDNLYWDWPTSREVTFGGKAFYAGWYRNDKYIGSSSDCPDPYTLPKQWKFGPLMIRGGESEDWYPGFAFNWNNETIPCPNYGKANMQGNQYGTAGGDILAWNDNDVRTPWGLPAMDEWFLVEVMMQANSGYGEPDGYAQVWMNGGSIGPDTDWVILGANEEAAGDPVAYGGLVIRGYIEMVRSGGRDPYTMYIDNVYCDNSWAAVALGDQPSWANCTWREYQTVVSWSDAEISVTGSVGDLTTSDTAYLFVRTEAGVVSSGVQVTIGESYAGNPLAITGASVVGGNATLSWTGPTGLTAVQAAEASSGLQILQTSSAAATIPVGGGNVNITIKAPGATARARIEQ